MLEQYFKYPRVLERLRSGALGGDMDRIAAHFAEIGYKHDAAKLYLRALLTTFGQVHLVHNSG